MKHEEILHRCFRCGYCKLPSDYTDITCPAYLANRFETCSPGGRMWLLRAWLNNDLTISERFAEIMFSCAACGNCVEQCAFPGFKDLLLDAFTAGREALLETGQVPAPVRDYLTRMQIHGNPYGKPAKNRNQWAADLDIPAFSGQEYLFFVDDVSGYDSLGQEIARSVAGLLQRAGISFGLLPEEAVSDGNDARAMGETALFEDLARRNIDLFTRLGVNKIITLSPHTLNAIKNHYPEFGGIYMAAHYTQILAFSMGYLPIRPNLNGGCVTIHDPCYLGRHNRDYQSCRMMLNAIPGFHIVEMDRNRKNALCCGGGGGNFFTDLIAGDTDAPARSRVREAVDSGADTLVTACPMCAIMLGAAAKTEGLDNRLQIKEISEFINTCLNDMPGSEITD
ncbi:MAG: (Fe-S)-binding protein [Thermodesulfobacteriota bacterium]|nr:(Fe-S)-binding protein [Thermodesulfobacteriota bacterium]